MLDAGAIRQELGDMRRLQAAKERNWAIINLLLKCPGLRPMEVGTIYREYLGMSHSVSSLRQDRFSETVKIRIIPIPMSVCQLVRDLVMDHASNPAWGSQGMIMRKIHRRNLWKKRWTSAKLAQLGFSHQHGWVKKDGEDLASERVVPHLPGEGC